MGNRKWKKYSLELKEKAVQAYLNGKGSYRTICVNLEIKDTKQLRSWVAKIQRGESLEDMRGKTKQHAPFEERTEFASVEEELAYVKAERDYLKKLYRSRFGKEWGA